MGTLRIIISFQFKYERERETKLFFLFIFIITKTLDRLFGSKAKRTHLNGEKCRSEFSHRCIRMLSDFITVKGDKS